MSKKTVPTYFCSQSVKYEPISIKIGRIVVVVVNIGGQRCPEEMRNSTRLWIRKDPSLARDSWQPFYWLEHHSRAAVIANSWRTVDHCQTIDVDRCWQTAKLQSVLRLCSEFYRSKDPTNSIKVLKERHQSTEGLSRKKPLTKLCLKCPLHLKYVLALRWEIWSARLSHQCSN